MAKKFKMAKLDPETHEFLKKKAEELNCSIAKAVKWAVMSKAKNMHKDSSVVQSVALTPAEMEMGTKTVLKPVKKLSQKEKKDEGWKRRHNLDFLELIGRRD